MTQILNQFEMTPEKGNLVGKANHNLLDCRINPATIATDLVAATAIKIVDVAGNNIFVDKAAATDAVFGFITKAISKDEPRGANEMVQIAFDNSIMFMEAGAAINLGAFLEINATTNKVITNAGVNKVIGMALRKATAEGDIIPALIKTPFVPEV